MQEQVVCEVDKRRKCDSYYICENKKLLKQIKELKDLLEVYQQLLSIYRLTLGNIKEGDSIEIK